MSIKNAMDMMPADVKAQIGDFKFYFGENTVPMTSSAGATITANKRTNAFLKGPEKSCNWVFYTDLLHLKKEAQQTDPKATGVANIVSNWKNTTTSNKDTFVCAKGMLMSGVALKGNLIR